MKYLERTSSFKLLPKQMEAKTAGDQAEVLLYGQTVNLSVVSVYFFKGILGTLPLRLMLSCQIINTT